MNNQDWDFIADIYDPDDEDPCEFCWGRSCEECPYA